MSKLLKVGLVIALVGYFLVLVITKMPASYAVSILKKAGTHCTRFRLFKIRSKIPERQPHAINLDTRPTAEMSVRNQ